MKDVMGLIYTGENDIHLGELTSQRAVAAMPIGGRYRVIDFQLSSMVHTGIKNVGIIAQKNYSSLMDHVGSGREWDLHGKQGMVILPPYLTRDNMGVYSGLLDALKSNTNFLQRSKQEYVVLTNSHTIYNVDFTDAIRSHVDHGADITLLYTKADASMLEFAGGSKANHAFVKVAPDGRVTDMEINPNAASYSNICMDVIIIKRTLLIHLTDQAFSHGLHSLYGDLLRPAIDSGELKIYGCEYSGYRCRVETVKSYYRANMDLLDAGVRQELFSERPIYTKVRDEVPAKYQPGCKVKNSLIADGCVIEGTVENCVLFRGVHIGKGAMVKDSIIMQDSEIGDDVELENVIFDKAVTIRRRGRLIGEKQYPIVIGKNVTL